MSTPIMSNQVALVTGASRGIGRAIALELGRNGATVVGTATTEQGAASITDYLSAAAVAGKIAAAMAGASGEAGSAGSPVTRTPNM